MSSSPSRHGTSKLGAICSLSYIALFTLCALYGISLITFNTSHSQHAAIFAIVLTLPWSIILVPFYDLSGLLHWYQRFSGIPVLYGFIAMLFLVPAMLINALVIYIIGLSFERGPKVDKPAKAKKK